MNSVKEYKLLGVSISPQTLDELLETISDTIQKKGCAIIASQNLHSVYSFHKSKELAELHKLAIKRVDGMPLIYLGKLLGYPLNRGHRVTWVDLIMPLMERAAKLQQRVFYLGADEHSVSKGIEIIKNVLPSLEIGYRNGFFCIEKDGEENLEVLRQIERFKPDILIVGMGMPRQEKWILNNKERLVIPVIMTSGAAIEYIAGTVKTPPRWMGRIGLEWFFRLLENPQRFAFRYLIEPWFIFGLAIRDLINKFFIRSS